jgi:hypothetical protein
MNTFTLLIGDAFVDKKFREMRYETVFLPFVLQWSAEVVFKLYMLSIQETHATAWDQA